VTGKVIKSLCDAQVTHVFIIGVTLSALGVYMSYLFKLIASLVVSGLIVSSACGKELKKLEIKTLFH